MRISDWSSDVCSSDLTSPIFGQRRLSRAKRRRAHRELRSTSVSPPAKTKMPPGPGSGPTIGVDRISNVPITSKAMRTAGWERRLGRSGVTGAIRSEEHTSELQSLMRISYAVFCLKQKTQKQG